MALPVLKNAQRFKTVAVYTLENGKYYAAAYAETDTVPVRVLEDCEISLPDVFSEG